MLMLMLMLTMMMMITVLPHSGVRCAGPQGGTLGRGARDSLFAAVFRLHHLHQRGAQVLGLVHLHQPVSHRRETVAIESVLYTPTIDDLVPHIDSHSVGRSSSCSFR
jgi:hypothetical protein